MDKEKNGSKVHVLVIPYPSQGHINPILQFSKRVVSKGNKVTLANTIFISKSLKPKSNLVQFDTISDGFDDRGSNAADSTESYMVQFQAVGSKTLTQLIERYQATDNPIDCVVYDVYLPWALDVAKQHGLSGVAFFNQSCTLNSIYYYVYNGLLELPILKLPVVIPGLPELDLLDMPSFIIKPEMYPDHFDIIVRNQFGNLKKPDGILVNTFYKLESQAVDALSSKLSPIWTIGPTIQPFYSDSLENNNDDQMEELASTCINWLSTKPKGSVAYVSLDSMPVLGDDQMEELAWGLKHSNCYFLWLVRESEESKLPKNFVEDAAVKGLLVRWCPHLDVLANEAVGCFLTNCGWNSTVEALSLGVSVIGMPQWINQPTNVKLIEDVWKMGKRAKVDGGSLIVTRQEIESCIRELLQNARGVEMKENAKKWENLALEAVGPGGTSDKNIDDFLSKISQH